MNKIKSLPIFVKNNLGLLIFFILFIILFRNFLYTYRMQLTKFLPYYDYQSQIIYYLTGDKNFDVQAPMNLRFLGLIVQFIIYKFIPCLELTRVSIQVLPYENYVCATFSSSLMNYISLCGIMTFMYIYAYKKLKLSIVESIICLFLSYIFIDHVEAFTLDRISILYLLLILYFLDNPKICQVLILLLCFVNEKVIFLLGVFLFIKFFIQKDILYKNYFWINVISGLFAILIFYFYANIMGHGYLQSEQSNGIYNTIFTEGLNRILLMFKTKAGLSNAVLPVLFAISPYIFSLIIRNDLKKKINFSNLEILVPLSLILFGAGGGMEQIGRYVMYSFPIWTPILSCQFYNFLKKYK